MTVPSLPVPVPAGAPLRAARRLAMRQIRRGAIIVAVVCTGMPVLVASQYQTMFRGSLDSSALDALTENPAIRVLFGAPVALDDQGGFTVWRIGTPVLVLAGVWMSLAATRITRGEEDTGRLDLLLAGRLDMVDVIRRYLVAVIAAALAISVPIGLGLFAVGTDAIGAVVFATAVLGVILYFGSAGLLAAQVMPTRAAAVGGAVGVLAFGLFLRVVADGVPALAWAAWATPFGLTARAAPYADNRLLPILVLAAYATLFAVAALVAARHRDVGGGLVSVAASRPPRTLLLSSVGGFAARRAIRPSVGWLAGIAAYFVIFGALIASILEFFEENPRFAELASTAGFAGLDSANGFAAALFGLLTIPTGLYAATRLANFVSDEKARRWTAVLAAPVSRIRLAGTEIAVVAVGVAVLHVIAGLAMWTGGLVTGAPFRIDDALAGALNSAPVAWMSLGAATLAVGWLPAAVGAIGALPVVGGFLFNVLTQTAGAPDWVVNVSPFAHLAAVPNTPPDWTANGVFIAVGGGLIAVGLAGYRHRDLST